MVESFSVGVAIPEIVFVAFQMTFACITTALVLGCVSIVFCQIILGPAAIIEGRKAQRRIDESNGTLTGRGMATAGVVLGCIAVALFLFYIAVAVLSASSNPRLR